MVIIRRSYLFINLFIYLIVYYLCTLRCLFVNNPHCGNRVAFSFLLFSIFYKLSIVSLSRSLFFTILVLLYIYMFINHALCIAIVSNSDDVTMIEKFHERHKSIIPFIIPQRVYPSNGQATL